MVAEAYPGIADHYPDAAVATFRTAQECVATIDRLKEDPDARRRMRQAAEEQTWRYHTWADRIAQLLEEVRLLHWGKAGATLTADTDVVIHRHLDTATGTDDPILLASAQYWNQRCRRLGRRAPGYYRLSDAAYRQTTDAWWERLHPLFQAGQLPAHSRVLDFGCGEGRFARRLAALEFAVTGVDISREMLGVAARSSHPNLTLRQLSLEGKLDVADGYFDALWVSTVLQHIPDDIFPAIVGELNRVVRPDGWLFLCENTHDYARRTSASGHVVFRGSEEYLQGFPGLAIVDSFEANGERHTVFSGRRRRESDSGRGARDRVGRPRGRLTAGRNGL